MKLTPDQLLRSAQDYCTPHPGLSKAQLLFEMERARRTIEYVRELLSSPASHHHEPGTAEPTSQPAATASSASDIATR
jgi:hypothetical protein